MTLGSRIAHFRKQKGWTQSQFAKAVGMSPSTVAMYETNRRTPDDATLSRLAEALEVSIEALHGAVGESPNMPAGQAPADEKANLAQQPSAEVEGPQPGRHSSSDEESVGRGATAVSPSNRTTFSLTREEARFILFMRMNPDCWPFLESYMYSDRAKRAQLEKTWRLLHAFQPEKSIER
jgi:transcriptional regulator with XRE-family HTH domain